MSASIPLWLGFLMSLTMSSAAINAQTCSRQIFANVVALDQVYFWNRLGAVQPQGMIYALLEDVVAPSGATSPSAGDAALRGDKRPRPITLRMNVGDCLTVSFTNLLNPTPVDQQQPATRTASVHVVGLQMVNGFQGMGSFVGTNPSGLAAPGQTRNYTFHAEREGTNLLYSTAAMVGGEGDSGTISAGLFGAVNVEPVGAEWYRSQVTAADIAVARIGTSPAGHPIVNYDAIYPFGHIHAGKPVFRMLDGGNRIAHTDLNAIITGPGRGSFPAGTYPANPVYPDRDRPFREFTIIFHDELGAVQAFPLFEDPVFSHAMHSTRDAFAINYGTGGIGAEILANRIGVGPMWNCTECKYEEFFLSSWVVGDPSMVVDVPANAPCSISDIRDGITCNPDLGPKATKAFYPDDPSNVYHSYMGDHVKFRNLHAGSDDHHIFHLHAHQWLHTPDSDKSTYLDSQAIGQGTSFTYEITHNGSGNRNQTVGDSIFHCHFYPHFAQGMWSLWRVHDVFEAGSQLDENGRPKSGTRALPDGEIAAGTPIPAITPIPGQAMPPMPGVKVSIVEGQVRVELSDMKPTNDGRPGDSAEEPEPLGNPGYPFFIPAVAGHRPPHPPADTIDDGGLPRHIITGGETYHVETRFDFTKEIEIAEAVEIAEGGTALEKAAMAFHAQRLHSSFLPNGLQGAFKANGLPARPGAPFADPCVDDLGNPVGSPRLYKAADIQLDAILNKKGWHFPQQRIISLWEDVSSFKFGSKPPEPLFFRANTGDCIEFRLTNLVPNIYELDDFQVRTPTDILGQHIHLVKFDVTSSDGGGNGFNYEDGSFSPDEVRERIHAINAAGGLTLVPFVKGVDSNGRDTKLLTAKAHPFFGPGPDENGDGVADWLGAQTTVQRWYADETLDLDGNDRTLRTVFTHDHFGPSTHQQVGLYAGLVVEPEGSDWYHNETGVKMGTRSDGGPTSWQAVIETADPAKSHREFLFNFADFQLAYHPNTQQPALYEKEARQRGEGFDDPDNAINPPGRIEIEPPLLYKDPDICPGGVLPPCPELVSSDDPGMFSVNYRNEPLALRVRDPATNQQAQGQAGDLAWAYSSRVTRADPALNTQPGFYDPLTFAIDGRDPFTPLLRAYENDNVQVRILVGAHEEEHNFSVNGVKWLFEPSEPNSGYRNSQMMGISEHFEFVIPALPKRFSGPHADFLWRAGAAVDSQWNGNWGLLRSYRGTQQNLRLLPSNPTGGAPNLGGPGDFNGVCPKTAPVREFNVMALTASDALPGATLKYNSRTTSVTHLTTNETHSGPLHDPTAILFVREEDMELVGGDGDGATWRLRAGVPIEPLILRANAGDCILVTLKNRFPDVLPDLDGWNSMPNIIDDFNANSVKPSKEVGLHPQMLYYDVTRDDGMNVGSHLSQTAKQGHDVTYRWYAGDLIFNPTIGKFEGVPIEFGATNLIPADPIKHTNKGAVGALIIEPQGATWVEDSHSRASATVTPASGQPFREFVLIFQSDINLRYGDGTAVEPLEVNDDPSERGQKAMNYRTEPIWFRMGYAPESPTTATRQIDYTQALANALVGGDPETPVFSARSGDAVRFRVLHPGGHNQNGVFEIHGHVWEEEPYEDESRRLGSNPLSQWQGARHGHGPTNHFDVLIKNGAGGKFRVTGDYLYRDFVPWLFHNGTWGIFRVRP